jgi:CheY-like chemotaxis protein
MDRAGRQVTDVLVVEDDAGEALLVREALAEAGGSALRCHIAADADSAVRFLWQQDGFTSAPRPRLILLDLNLGATHGLELLARLKSDDDLKTIPVVVLSSSRHPADIHHSYAHHASAYVVKPVSLDDFADMIKVLDACFLRLAEPSLPSLHADGYHHPVPGMHPCAPMPHQERTSSSRT